tara:strand:- start:856 stop:1362 length:507 start_codon:yes stop_codon:yes gene_type:complete
MFLLVLSQSASAGFFDLAPQPLPYAAPEVQFISQATPHNLSGYKGHKVMLWLFSTWCHTCVAGVQVMQEQQATWEKSGLIILAIRNHNNGGYQGPDMPVFMQKIAPRMVNMNNWVTGEATEKMYHQLNAKKFPDIYFLIDEKGFVQVVSTAPTATMNKILNFARGASK